MPLTPFQQQVLALVAQTRSPDSYLAGGSALHLEPRSERYSDDLDFFHDSSERVAEAFAEDARLLESAGYELDVQISQLGLVRAIVRLGEQATRIDWAHESAWRFMPVIQDPVGGYVLHPVDAAVNKTLALAGRDEPRDFIDILAIHTRILAIAGLVWAAPGKDPGFSPLSLLELLKRRGPPRPEEIERLRLRERYDPVSTRTTWRRALEETDRFIRARPASEMGCLYYDTRGERFTLPDPDIPLNEQGIVPHFGAPGGVIPRVVAATETRCSDARVSRPFER